MNKKPFVDEVNAYALMDAISNPTYWKDRIECIMGYAPHTELFVMEEDKRGLKQAEIEIAYRMLKNDRPIDDVSKCIGLSQEEMNYLLEGRH